VIAGLLDKNGNIQPFISLDATLNLDKLDVVKKEVEEFLDGNPTERDFWEDSFYHKLPADETESTGDFSRIRPYHTEELVKLKNFNNLISQILTDVIYLRIIPAGGDTHIHNDVQTDIVFPEKQTFTDKIRDNFWFWIRFSDKKQFFIIDPETHERYYVTGRVVLFNKWDYHATDKKTPETEISVRMLGYPTENIKKYMKHNWDTWEPII
tara:strand:+ start:66 stop:695 length:630 start_codon:yes stop_codon:yes gene_type:complete